MFARRDAESLQNVPLTITAIGAATLAKYNVTKPADIVSRIPTLNVQTRGAGLGGLFGPGWRRTKALQVDEPPDARRPGAGVSHHHVAAHAVAYQVHHAIGAQGVQ